MKELREAAQAKQLDPADKKREIGRVDLDALYRQARQTLLDAGYREGQTYRSGDILNVTGLEYHKIAYLVNEAAILSPRRIRRGKKTFLEFDFADLQNALVVQALRQKQGLTVKATKVLLEQYEAQPGPSYPYSRTDSGKFVQTARATAYLQSRLLYEVTALLCGRDLPPNSVLLIRKNTFADMPQGQRRPQESHLLEVDKEVISAWATEFTPNEIKAIYTADGDFLVSLRLDRAQIERVDFFQIKHARISYELYLGLPTKVHDPSLLEHIRINIAQLRESELIQLLLDFCFGIVVDNQPRYYDTLLTAVVNQITSVWPHLYCQIYGPPDVQDNARLEAYSQNFPLGVTPMTQISCRQLPEGWPYRTGQELIIHKAAETHDDPRIPNQPQTRAAASFPTSVKNGARGVIYIWTRKQFENEEDFISPQMKKLFRMLGTIVGEMHQRMELIKETHKSNHRMATIVEPRQRLKWEDLRSKLEEAFDETRTGLAEGQQLLILAVNVDGTQYRKIITSNSQAVGDWIIEHLCLVCYRFCERNRIEGIAVFQHPEHENMFIVLGSKVSSEFDKPKEMQFREILLNQLNSFQVLLGLQVYLWTLRYSYSELRSRIQDTDKIVDFLASEARTAPGIAEFASKAHEYEEANNYEMAAFQCQDALGFYPDNQYFARHLIKYLIWDARYEEAIKIGETTLERETGGKDPELLELLGNAYRFLQKYPEAREKYEAALGINTKQDRLLHRLIADTYLLEGGESTAEAVTRYSDLARQEDDDKQKAKYHWLAGLAHMRGNKFEEAGKEFNNALRLDKKNDEYYLALAGALRAGAEASK